MSNQWVRHAIHWLARFLGTLLLVMIAALAVGEGIPNPMKQPLAVRIEMIAMLIQWLGLLIAWKSELFGGTLILFGYASFCAVEWQALRIDFPFGLFLVVGLLYLLSSCIMGTKKHRKGVER